MGETELISKLTSKSQTVMPRAVRQKLGLRPGDRIRYRMQGKNVFIEKLVLSETKDDPFLSFDEWSSEKDDKAFANL